MALSCLCPDTHRLPFYADHTSLSLDDIVFIWPSGWAQITNHCLLPDINVDRLFESTYPIFTAIVGMLKRVPDSL